MKGIADRSTIFHIKNRDCMKNLYRYFVIVLLLGNLTSTAQTPVASLQATTPAATHATMPAKTPAFPARDIDFRGEDLLIGETMFDLQTYDCMPRRLVSHGDGKVTAAWMSGFDVSGWPDRGTSVNHFDGTDWGTAARVEVDSIRTGFPAMDVLSDGTVVVVAHKTTGAPPYQMQVNRLAPGATEWEVSYVPTAEPTGLVWPYIAVGGSDGMTLHLVAINFEPTADRQIHYFRSPDGGLTWDIQDFIIPGLDTEHYGEIFASSYCIDAYENTVAVAHFGEWKDCAIFKSIDNGDNWTETKVLDFPLPLDYVDDTGYSADIVTPHNSQPDPLAIFTSDGGGNILVDQDGLVHVVFGNRFVIDIDLANGTTEYYPPQSGIAAHSDISGISYWDENMAGFQPFTIANLVDADGDGVITYLYPDTLPDYWGNNLVAYPSLGADADGNLYMTYCATTEDFADDITRAQYRHSYVIRSTDGGGSWSEPYDLINPDLSDPDGYYFAETVYPSMAKRVDDKVRIIYQLDFTPDANVVHSYVAPTENFFVYVELNSDLTPVKANQISETSGTLTVFPNPASGVVQVRWDALLPGHELRLYSATGVWLRNLPVPTASGVVSIDLSGYAPGLYWVVADGRHAGSAAKVVVQR